MARKRRILLHPGFHRTGTASIDAMLDANRAALSPHVGLLTGPALRRAAMLCTDFSSDLHPLRLTDLVETLDDILAENGLHPILNDPRDMVMSCVDFAGLMPGSPAVPNYAAVPIVTAYLAGYLTERFPAADVQIVYTTRGPREWLYSAWRTQLFQTRLTLDWPDFSATYARAANLDHAMLNAAHAVAPVAVFTLPLEEAVDHPLGPGGALLELLDLPDAVSDRLIGGPHVGRGGDAAMAADFLALNRSALPRKALSEEKARRFDQAAAEAVAPINRADLRQA